MSALNWLVCPHCRSEFRLQDKTMTCQSGHSYDLAKQGYVNLLGSGQPQNADTPAMLEARDRFLRARHYAPIAEAISEQVSGQRILEVGAGTGFYLSQVLDRLPEAQGLASDVSAAACRRAARCHPRASAVVADTWQRLPLANSAVDTVLCVFAPRNILEFQRVLAPEGTLILVVPQEAHLLGLRTRYGLLGVAPDKHEKLEAALAGWSVVSRQNLEFELSLTADEVADLIAMGPNAFHSSNTQGFEPASVGAAVEILVAKSAA